MPPSFQHDPERLLADLRWIRRLARPLVGDEELAADLTQETWLVALRSRRGQGYPSRSWLAGVLRNLAFKRRRGEARRARRERDGRGSGSSPSAEELVSRAEAQQRLGRAVLELAEPLKSTLLLRFFEELSTREIARRMGVETDTVRSRIRRGLELLRVRFEKEGGMERDQLRAWLMPLSSAALPGAVAIGFPMKIATKLVLGLLMGALGWTAWTAARSAPTEALALGGVEVTPVQPTSSDDGPTRQDTAVPPAEGLRSSVGVGTASLRGRLVFVYPDGREVDDAGGRFQLRSSTPAGNERVFSIELERGLWSIELERGAEFVAESVVMKDGLEQRAALLDPAFSGSVPATGEMLYRIALEPIITLHVTDSLSGAELPRVEVLDGAAGNGSWPLVRDAQRLARVRLTGQSPLRIPFGDPTLHAKGLWVGAAHRGWERLRPAPGRDHELWVELQPAGELEIFFAGGPAVADTELALVRLDGRKGIVIDEGDDWDGPLDLVDRVLLTGVPAGQYRIMLRMLPFHADWSLAQRLGSARAQVIMGERTTIQIDRAELVRRPLTTVKCELLIPPEWGVEQFRLTLDPIDVGPTELSPARRWTQTELPVDQYGLRHFELASMPTGRYLLELIAYPIVTHREVVRIEASPTRLLFAVPAPVELQVRARDAVSGDALAIAELMYGQGSLPDVETGRVFPADCDAAASAGHVSLRAPEGPLTVMLETVDGRRARAETTASGHDQELVVEVRAGTR